MNQVKTYLKGLISYTAKMTHLSEQFIRFLLVGVINTIFGYSAFAFFVLLGCNYIFAPLFSTILGVLFNFKTIGVLVFRNKDNKLIARFFCVYGIVYLCNVGALKAFELNGFHNMYVSGLILVMPMALLGYGLNKKFVFERKIK